MPELRPYQTELVAEAKTALAKYRRIIVQLPTGGGKGMILGRLASMTVAKGNRVLILCHGEEILKQNARQCEKWGVATECVFAKTKARPDCNCVCMMAQTARQRIKKAEWLEWFKSFSLYIIDECHRSEFNYVFETIPPRAFVIGFSASPVRYGHQRQLGLDYGAIVVGPTVSDLVRGGYLCRCRLFSLDAPKMDDVEWDYVRGDYNLGQMAAKFRSPARYVGAVDNYERLCLGQKCLVFCSSSEQTIEVTAEFNRRGIKAKYSLSGSFDEDEKYSGDRDEVVQAFARGEFPVLVNLGQFTTGLDIPDIKVVMLMYATTSVVRYLQSLGRASRPADGKGGEFLCLDFGCNFERLGRYEDNREWSVWHDEGKEGGVPPVKECPQCHKMVPVQWQDCKFCGYHWPTRREEYVAELQEIVAPTEGGEEETLERYVAGKKLMGWNNNRILVSVCVRNADNPKEAFMRAIEVLRTKEGENISPKYWYFFKKNILDRKKVKKENKDEMLKFE